MHWTKLIAEEQSRFALSGRKTSRRLRRLYQVRACRLKHAFVVLAAEIARLLKRCRVTALFFEDLTGIRDEMDFGPKNLLVHNFWAFRMLNNLIEAACTRFGIKIRSNRAALLPAAPSAALPSVVLFGTRQFAADAVAFGTLTPTLRSTSCFRAPRRGTRARPRP